MSYVSTIFCVDDISTFWMAISGIIRVETFSLIVTSECSLNQLQRIFFLQFTRQPF
jgi:hypothetical protein